MDPDLRLFFDIKRELEYKIAELKNDSDSYQYEKTIGDLKYKNSNLIEQINEKLKTIEEKDKKIKTLNYENQIFLNENNAFRSEIKKYKSNEEQLLLQFKSRQDKDQKTSILKSILKFFNKNT